MLRMRVSCFVGGDRSAMTAAHGLGNEASASPSSPHRSFIMTDTANSITPRATVETESKRCHLAASFEYRSTRSGRGLAIRRSTMASNFQPDGHGNVQNNTSGKNNRVKTKIVNHNYAASAGPARPILSEKWSMPLPVTGRGSAVAGWISAIAGIAALPLAIWPPSATVINTAFPLPGGDPIVLGVVVFAVGAIAALFLYRAHRLIKSGLRAFPSSSLLPAIAPRDGRLRLVYYKAECPTCPTANIGKLQFRSIVTATREKLVKGEIRTIATEWEAWGFCDRIVAHQFPIDLNA
jgi:hypothetical protein